MKKLNSRFSQYNQTKLIFFVLPFLFFASTCKKRNDQSAQLSSEKLNLPIVAIGEDVVSNWLPLNDGAATDKKTTAWMDASSCVGSKLKLKAVLVAGKTFSEVTFEQNWTGFDAIVTVEGIKINLPGSPILPENKNELCALLQASATSVYLTTNLSTFINSNINGFLSAVAPDCQSVEWGQEGWSCSLKKLMPQAAIVKLEDFQLGMTRKWSRQPYILARRAGVSMALAKSAAHLNSDSSTQKFCRLLEFSLPEELPLIMTSQRWRDTLCEGNDKQRREAALHGLSKAVDELVMIRDLFETSSHPATLSIRIPNSEIPGRVEKGLQPLRVTFIPDQEVVKNLVEVAGVALSRPGFDRRKAKKIVALEALQSLEEHSNPICWHPLFGDSSDLFRVADGMRLTGSSFKGRCLGGAQGLKEHQADPLAKYLMQSLSSETEFVVDNGKSKLIRLPEGKYSYSIQVLPQNPIDAEDEGLETTAETKGAIQWGHSHHHVINAWAGPQ